ncbi:MAG: hypothetical protein NT080_02180 [Spirochaetes bacterium]|nr:hypothetical protein [Spirochaetota bacterium]
MESMLARLTGANHAKAFAGRDAVLAAACTENSRGIRTREEYRAWLRERTVIVTMLAGAGTRWVRSLKEAVARGEDTGFDPRKPRGLFPVRNLLGRGPNRIPIAAYSLDAGMELGDRLVIVRGYEEEIRSSVLDPLGYDPGSVRFATQEVVNGKPLGHGDAARQTENRWSAYEYVVVNFGGDASNPRTMFDTLAVFDALVSSGEPVAMMMPAALFDAPAYPIELDTRGRPTAFGHAKLHGGGAASGPGYANVGVRMYRAAALLAVVERIASAWYEPGVGYSIPENDPAGREFALDNVDAELAASGLARILPIALPEELTPVKSLEDLPRFGAAIEKVRADPH